MTTMADAIETKFQDLFSADTALDPVKVFCRGEPLVVPDGDYPLVILFVIAQGRIAQETGLWIYQYDGYIAVETKVPDGYTVHSRRVTIDSYTLIRDLLDAITTNLEANLSLDGLTNETETVRVIDVGNKSYGLQDRGNSLNNRGEVPISVQTQKPKG